MRIPKFIKKNGTIGFAAPSFGCNIEPYKSGFENAQKKFRDMGYHLEIGPNCYAGCGIGISNTPQKCAEEINRFFQKEELGAVLSCGGGELMCEILEYIDFERLKQLPPKWFMGYSDNTNLTFLLTTLCDMASVYGPCAPAFGMKTWHKSLNDAWGILEGRQKIITGYDSWEKESKKDAQHPLEPYNTTEKTKRVFYPDKEAEFSGRLLGGCLDCLGKLVGTKYDKVAEFCSHYKEDGIIWYFEACELNMADIRRTLWQLEQSGWFSNVKGFLVGRPMYFGQELFGLDQYNAVCGILDKYHVPILMDLDIGHLPPMMPMVNGAYTHVQAKQNQVTLTYVFEEDL